MTWAYCAFGVVLHQSGWSRYCVVAIGRGADWKIDSAGRFLRSATRAFGTEHFTLAKAVASLIPAWIPWHMVWVYLVGTCFIAAGLSLVTRIQARLSASLLAITFFLFVVLMDAPGWARSPGSRFAMALTLRELSFSGGALALAASLSKEWRERGTHVLATVARYFVAIPVIVYSVEQFMHAITFRESHWRW